TVQSALGDLKSGPAGGIVPMLAGRATPAVGVASDLAFPCPMPPVAIDDKAGASRLPLDCAPVAPRTVTITGVELGLLPTSVFVDGGPHLYLVPSYRFLGHFEDGTAWEPSVVALHPDAIA